MSTRCDRLPGRQRLLGRIGLIDSGGMGLISGRKAFHRPMADGTELLNKIQDVYPDKRVTLA
jgi:DhnA family fructose-bisphosphate aldolase class Ia